MPSMSGFPPAPMQGLQNRLLGPQAPGGNPLDGNALFAGTMGAGPAAQQPPSPGAPPMAAAQMALAKLNLTPQQVSDELQNSENVVHLLAPLVRQDGGVTQNQVISRTGDAVAAGMFSAQQAASFLGRMGDVAETDAPGGGTDRLKASLLKGFLAEHLHSAVMVNAHLQGIAQALGPMLPPPTSNQEGVS